MTRIFFMPAAAAAVAIVCAFTGWTLAGGRRARFLAPLSGALLAAVAVFGLIPEIASETGWLATLALAAAGYGALALLDARGYPVCPGCSHGHEFSGALVTATAVHAFIDGWGMVAAGHRGSVSAAIVSAMMLHKIPEGLALGTMLRTSAQSSAMSLAFIAESPTVLGGLMGLWAASAPWTVYPLALVAGCFLFLGVHAMFPGGPRRLSSE